AALRKSSGAPTLPIWLIRVTNWGAAHSVTINCVRASCQAKRYIHLRSLAPGATARRGTRAVLLQLPFEPRLLSCPFEFPPLDSQHRFSTALPRATNRRRTVLRVARGTRRGSPQLCRSVAAHPVVE